MVLPLLTSLMPRPQSCSSHHVHPLFGVSVAGCPINGPQQAESVVIHSCEVLAHLNSGFDQVTCFSDVTGSSANTVRSSTVFTDEGCLAFEPHPVVPLSFWSLLPLPAHFTVSSSITPSGFGVNSLRVAFFVID